MEWEHAVEEAQGRCWQLSPHSSASPICPALRAVLSSVSRHRVQAAPSAPAQPSWMEPQAGLLQPFPRALGAWG